MSVRLLKDIKFVIVQKEKKFLKGYVLKVSISNINSLLLINILFEEIFEKFYCLMKVFEQINNKLIMVNMI